jgi:phosphohistidine phosphatase
VIYLIRHAHAEAASGGPDEDRPLSPQGRSEAEILGLALKKLEAPVAKILSSPFLRARQTGEILARGLGVPLEIRDRMASGASPGDLLDVIRGEARGTHLALVGHNPEIGILSALIVAMVPGGTVSFKPGSVCCVELDPDKQAGRLVWFRNPEDLASLVGKP